MHKRKKARKPRDNEPKMDLKVERKRICGVDLTTIDGINVMTAFTVISEVGTDMSGFQDENHFTSWMGLAPSKDISGGKTVGRGKKKVKNRVGRGTPHGSHLAAGQRHPRGCPLPPSVEATTELQGRSQSDGPLSRDAHFSPVDEGRGMGGIEVRCAVSRDGAPNGNWQLCSQKPKDSPWFP